jgi:rhamnosyltransferase
MDEFLAVVVLYKCSMEQCTTLITLEQALIKKKATLEVVVYDNSPTYNKQKNGGFKTMSIIYKADYNNSGVSSAYNYAHQVASQKGKKWLLLLDQDTNLPPDTLDQYSSAIDQYPTELLFTPVMVTKENKIISPCNFKFMKGTYAKTITYGINYFKGHSLINSGLCIGVNAFEKNNGYNSLIKLDYSDHDFITRFAKNVRNKYVVINLNVLHQLSTSTKNKFNEDKTRFNYYLEGSKHFTTNIVNSFFLKTVNFLRSVKLSYAHKNLYFIKTYLTYFFKCLIKMS